jgi:hypothetical protein
MEAAICNIESALEKINQPLKLRIAVPRPITVDPGSFLLWFFSA